jgi:TRAP-type C4-dicarboxylate transport system permease large subunit
LDIRYSRLTAKQDDILISILADTSIGRALVAGIMPGIVLALLLMLAVAIRGIFKPQDIPKLDIRVTWKDCRYSKGFFLTSR